MACSSGGSRRPPRPAAGWDRAACGPLPGPAAPSRSGAHRPAAPRSGSGSPAGARPGGHRPGAAAPPRWRPCGRPPPRPGSRRRRCAHRCRSGGSSSAARSARHRARAESHRWRCAAGGPSAQMGRNRCDRRPAPRAGNACRPDPRGRGFWPPLRRRPIRACHAPCCPRPAAAAGDRGTGPGPVAPGQNQARRRPPAARRGGEEPRASGKPALEVKSVLSAVRLFRLMPSQRGILADPAMAVVAPPPAAVAACW